MKVLLMAGMLVAGAPAPPPPAPAARCSDSPLLERLPGCVLQECRQREYDEAELQAGPLDRTGEFPKKLIEGQTASLTYSCPASLTLDEIAQRARASLRKKGFAIVHSGEMYYNHLPGFTMRKGRDWVQVVSEPFGDENGYTVTTVRAVATAADR